MDFSDIISFSHICVAFDLYFEFVPPITNPKSEYIVLKGSPAFWGTQAFTDNLPF